MITSEVSTAHCPNCQAQRLDGAEECARCGIILAKGEPGGTGVFVGILTKVYTVCVGTMGLDSSIGIKSRSPFALQDFIVRLSGVGEIR